GSRQHRVSSTGHTPAPVPFLFFFQAEDGIRDGHVTGVQTCALPISAGGARLLRPDRGRRRRAPPAAAGEPLGSERRTWRPPRTEIGRASCRERVSISGVAGTV